jgi:hypothetical protein
MALGGGGLLIIIVMLFLGADPSEIIQLLDNSSVGRPMQGSVHAPSRGRIKTSTKTDEEADFVSVLLADTEDVWRKLFSERRMTYEAPKLVLFSDSVSSACGFASAATGPFYCSGDRKAYLDLSFFEELKRMGGKGDFSAAYVIAHEVGHHVQNLMQVLPRVARMKAAMSQVDANALQVRVELQADCYAGIWAHHGNKDRGILERGDIEEAIATASAIGDDHLQKRAGRRVQPESFTHGTSKQRMDWFMRGFEQGNFEACQTFS